jgi:hypothetical protein
MLKQICPEESPAVPFQLSKHPESVEYRLFPLPESAALRLEALDEVLYEFEQAVVEAGQPLK